MKRNLRRNKHYDFCEHCGLPIEGNGGKFLLPMEISGLPERWAYVHNNCLKAYLEEWDRLFQPITPRTIFDNGRRRDLPEI